MIAAALHSIAVPTWFLVDLDLLNDEQPLRGLWENLGGAWEEIKVQHSRVTKAVQQTRKAPQVSEVKTSVERILPEAGPVSDEQIKQLRSVLKATGGWQHVKQFGARAIPAGDATTSFIALRDMLRSRGVHLVPEGELEGFARSIGGHGPQWVNGVLKRDLLLDAELQAARDYVRSLGLLEVPSGE